MDMLPSITRTSESAPPAIFADPFAESLPEPLDMTEPLDRVFSALAIADVQGLPLSVALLGAVIALDHRVSSADAVDLAATDRFDDRVRSAREVMDMLIKDAREAETAATR